MVWSWKVLDAKTKSVLSFSRSGQEPLSYLVELFELTLHSSVHRRVKLIWSDREISSSQNLPPENPKICLRQFFQCCDSCSVLLPSSFRRLRRLEFCPRIFTDGFAVWILPPTGSLFGASGAKKLQLYLLEPSAREFASGLKICPRRSSLHFSSVLHPCTNYMRSVKTVDWAPSWVLKYNIHREKNVHNFNWEPLDSVLGYL